MKRGILFDRLRDVVPRVTEVEYQKPNKGYVKLGYVYAVNLAFLFKCANCTRTDDAQVAELVHTMRWFGFTANSKTCGSWTAVRARRRGHLFTTKADKKNRRRRSAHKAILRFRFKKYAEELKDLGDEG